MKVFIMCVGTRDPLWNPPDAGNPYDPQQSGFDLEQYARGPIVTFFESLLEELLSSSNNRCEYIS